MEPEALSGCVGIRPPAKGAVTQQFCHSGQRVPCASANPSRGGGESKPVYSLSAGGLTFRGFKILA